jgi:CCCH-type zinc finger/Zinc finger C-x8-C-x5-C-x3-H type (and similar)
MAPCRFFLQGRCHRGSKCTFDHQQPESGGSSFLRAGATVFVPSSALSTPAANSPSILYSEPCRFFAKGFCAKGETCSYRHIVSAALSEQEVTAGRIADNQPNVAGNSVDQPNLTNSLGVVAEDTVITQSITDLVCIPSPLVKDTKD